MDVTGPYIARLIAKLVEGIIADSASSVMGVLLVLTVFAIIFTLLVTEIRWCRLFRQYRWPAINVWRGLFLVTVFIAIWAYSQQFHITYTMGNGRSMEPTLHDRYDLIIYRWVQEVDELQTGDIVSVHVKDTDGQEEYWVKRIAVFNHYNNEVLLFGDNWLESYDSRKIGAVSAFRIDKKVIKVIHLHGKPD